MALEYHTVKFSNDVRGIAQKNRYCAQLAAQGWRISSEVIEQGHLKGGEACCLFTICAPLAFLSGRTSNVTVTTFERQTSACAHCGTLLPADAVFCRSCGTSLVGSQPSAGKKVCPKCGTHVAVDQRFCQKCGTQLPTTTPSG